jgi:aspartate-semialdehyde dehydrogenase
MLALVEGRLAAALPLRSVSATVLEPASERGRAAMDELQEQTVGLLSFKTVPREQHDAQVAFNLLPRLGAEARVAWAETRRRIAADTALLAPGLPEVAVQVVHAPVFHGLTVSAMVEFAEPLTVRQLERALAGSPIDLVGEGSDPPSNLSAAGQSEVLAEVRAAFVEEAGRRFWLWLAADNLRLSALGAMQGAMAIRHLRPRGTVQ